MASDTPAAFDAWWDADGDHEHGIAYNAMRAAFAAGADHGRAEEREACAGLAEQHAAQQQYAIAEAAMREVADLIRARTTP